MHRSYLVLVACVVVASARLSTASGGNATAVVEGELEETLFRKVLAVATPDIVRLVRNLTIPAINTTQFALAPFKLTSFDLQNVALTFASPSTVAVAVTGLSLAMPPTNFSIDATVVGVKLSCKGDVSATVGASNLTLDTHVNTVKQRLNFSAGSVNASFGNVNIKQAMYSDACKLAEDIIQSLVGNIDQLLDRLVVQDLPKAIAPLVEKALNDAMAALPLAVVGNPVVTPQGIAASIDLIASLSGDRAHRRLRRPRSDGQGLHATVARDIVLQAPQASINAVLAYEDGLHHLEGTVAIPPSLLNCSSLAQLFPGIAKVCANCPLDIDINATEAPTVTFGGDAVDAGATMLRVGLAAVTSTGKQAPLFSINVNVSLDVVDVAVRGPSSNVIWFQLQLGGFAMSLSESEIGPIDVKRLSPIVAILLKAVLLPEFNKKFKGLTLPAPLINAVIDVSPGAATVAIDVDLPQ